MIFLLLASPTNILVTTYLDLQIKLSSSADGVSLQLRFSTFERGILDDRKSAIIEQSVCRKDLLLFMGLMLYQGIGISTTKMTVRKLQLNRALYKFIKYMAF